MDTTKGLDIDKITMSSELWYLQDYDNSASNFSYTVPAKSAGQNANTIEVMTQSIKDGHIGIIEVQDVASGRWYEVQNAITLPLNSASWQLLISPLVKNGQIGVGIWRPATTGTGFPAYQLNIRARTFLPPFTT